MFETTKIILTNNTRETLKKIKESPILYLFFIGIMVFSILLFAFLAFYVTVVDVNFHIELYDLFFLIFAVYIFKPAYDFYNYFINSGEISYALSTDIDFKKTISEVFLGVFSIDIFIWFGLSLLFLFFCFLFGLNIAMPFEYMLFNMGVISAIFIGCSIVLSFFSPNRLRLLPTAILLVFIFVSRHPIYVALTLPLSLLHLIWNLKNSIASYRCIRRKERISERSQIKIRSTLSSIFYKETTILWRNKLFFSFISSSAMSGLLAGYLYLYGDEIFIPASLRSTFGEFLPALFVFMGILIVVVYNSVFPALNLFLNEEKTMWIIRHLPVNVKKILMGKLSVLFLCFITTIPFISFILIFIGLDKLFYVTWFLVFSYIIGVIISLPLGVKYVGKKSDIMLFYSVTIILFGVLGFFSLVSTYIYNNMSYAIPILLIMLVFEIPILYISIAISSEIYKLRYPKLKQYT